MVAESSDTKEWTAGFVEHSWFAILENGQTGFLTGQSHHLIFCAYYLPSQPINILCSVWSLHFGLVLSEKILDLAYACEQPTGFFWILLDLVYGKASGKRATCIHTANAKLASVCIYHHMTFSLAQSYLSSIVASNFRVNFAEVKTQIYLCTVCIFEFVFKRNRPLRLGFRLVGGVMDIWC